MQEFLNYFQLVDPWNPTQAVNLGNKNFYLLNYLRSPQEFIVLNTIAATLPDYSKLAGHDHNNVLSTASLHCMMLLLL